MPTLKAVASGPILFADSDGGQLSIPPSALHFEKTGDQWALWVPTPFVDAKDWLEHLVTTGFIQMEQPTVTSVPSSPPVLTLTTATPGAWGNGVMATITYVTPTTYTITVAASIAFELDTLTMANTLGTELILPTQGGPVFVVGATLVPGRKPMNSSVPLEDELPVDVLTFDGASTAFQLQARKVPPALKPITATITNASSSSTEFRLTLAWSSTSEPIGIAVPDTDPLTTLRGELTAALGYLVDVVFNGGKPKSGSFYLTGGTDGTKAQASTTTV